jgi:hypothetical protein
LQCLIHHYYFIFYLIASIIILTLLEYPKFTLLNIRLFIRFLTVNGIHCNIRFTWISLGMTEFLLNSSSRLVLNPITLLICFNIMLVIPSWFSLYKIESLASTNVLISSFLIWISCIYVSWFLHQEFQYYINRSGNCEYFCLFSDLRGKALNIYHWMC